MKKCRAARVAILKTLDDYKGGLLVVGAKVYAP